MPVNTGKKIELPRMDPWISAIALRRTLSDMRYIVNKLIARDEPMCDGVLVTDVSAIPPLYDMLIETISGILKSY